MDRSIFPILHVEVDVLISAVRIYAVAWLALVSLTLLSFEAFVLPNNIIQKLNLTFIIIAFFKVRIVAMYFMELRYAPLMLRAIAEGWIWLTLLILIFVTEFHVVL
jgi:hypothetical protein